MSSKQALQTRDPEGQSGATGQESGYYEWQAPEEFYLRLTLLPILLVAYNAVDERTRSAKQET
jgi:hypothetical protein